MVKGQGLSAVCIGICYTFGIAMHRLRQQIGSVCLSCILVQVPMLLPNSESSAVLWAAC